MHREYAPDETKRDVDEDVIKAEAEQPEKVTEAPAEKSSFTDVGDKPPVVEAAVPAGPTASQQAFGGSDFDLEAAREWNASHPELVAEFNKLTNNACVEFGTVDPEKVRDWQLAHGIHADGKVAAGTVGKAKASVAPEQKAEDTNQAQQDTRKENAPEEQQVVAKEALAPAPSVEIAAAVLTTQTPETTVEDDSSYMEANEVEDAIEWNDKHEDEVAAFNKATNNSCVVKGKLDPKKVWDWQDNNGITADGCVDTKTVIAAQDVEKAKHPKAEIAAAETPIQTQV